jgi:hypothetical protein
MVEAGEYEFIRLRQRSIHIEDDTGEAAWKKVHKLKYSQTGPEYQ